MTFRKTLLGGTCLAIQPLLLNALSLPVMAYIIRGLGPSAYGQWTMAAAMMGVLGFIANLGLRGAFVRHVAAEPHTATEAMAEQLGLRLVLAALASILAMLLCLVLKYPPVVIECAAIGAAALFVSTLAATLVDVLQATGRSAIIAVVNMIAGFLLTAASAVVIWLRMGPVGLSAAYMIAPIVSAAILYFIVRKQMPIRVRFDFFHGLRLLNRSRAFAAQNLLNSASSYVEALYLPQLIGAANFGIYITGTLLPLRLGAIPDGFCTAAYPALARRFRDGRTSGTRLTLSWLGFILACCLTAALGIFALAGPISHILFPAHPDSCRMVIRVTIWALPLFGIESAIGYAINAAGADGAQARAAFPAALCNVVLTIVLMDRLGISGACIALPLRHAVRIVMLTTCFLRWHSASTEELPVALAMT
jgi:O-antigen/teichoic acid export membrane protein